MQNKNGKSTGPTAPDARGIADRVHAGGRPAKGPTAGGFSRSARTPLTGPLACTRHPNAYTLRLARLDSLCDQVNERFKSESWRWRARKYANSPTGFARDILGSWWWAKQEKIARALVQNRRVAVKSANGVGKTYLAADLVLWFLYTHEHAVVLTTAPTWRQVRHVLWQEIRKRFRQARENLPGTLITTRLDAGPGWFAIGLATDEPARFQGFHAENLLIVFDEASGIPDDIWDAAEGVAVAENNRILAIGNPLRAQGRFYKCFQSPLWRKLTISALEHPNITGKGPTIPGCVTRTALQDRLQDWCDDIPTTVPPPNDKSILPGPAARPVRRRLPSEVVHGLATAPRASPTEPALQSCPSPVLGRGVAEGRGEGLPTIPAEAASAGELQTRVEQDTFNWEGNTYRPNNLFRARVLGEFPSADDESLIPLRWIEAAIERALHPSEHHKLKGARRAAADIARFGNDFTVIGLRIGNHLTHMHAIQGCDLMEVAGEIASLAYRERPESIAIDSIGIGAGVVDRLRELDIQGIEGINVSHRAYDSERFSNRRAELYWGLRERFRLGDIAIPNDSLLSQELASVKYRITSRGQIQIESKDEMKKRGGHSPDRADMLALLFDDSLSWLDSNPDSLPFIPRRESPAARLRQEMQGW